jgi:molybdate transport system regulatory protein
MPRGKINLRVRCWIMKGNRKFFGLGPAELMEHIEVTGSLSQAARRMGISYRKAWSMVNSLNRGTSPYLLLHKGGSKGGGASLTPAGKKTLTMYRNLETKLQKVIDRVPAKTLKNF